MYCYSIEQHEEDVEEISIVMNKITGMLNLRERISSKTEIDETELADIVVCVDLVCNGTDLRREDIVIRDGASVSFEKEDNILVRFLTALVMKVKSLLAKLMKWKDSLFDRKNVLGKMIESTRNLLNMYDGSEDSPVVIRRGLDTFVARGKPITNYPELATSINRVSNIIKVYDSKIFPGIKSAESKISQDLMLVAGNKTLYQSEIESFGVEENNATTASKDIDKILKDIHLTVKSTTDGYMDTVGRENVSIAHTGPMIGNLSLTCHYSKPLYLTDGAYFESLHKFKLRLTKPESQIEHSFREIEFKRWSSQVCAQAIEDVAKVHKDLDTLSDIMKGSVRSVESFSKTAEKLLKDTERATDDSAETIKLAQAQRKLINAVSVFNTIHSTVPEHLYEHVISQMLNVLNLTRRHIRNEGTQEEK